MGRLYFSLAEFQATALYSTVSARLAALPSGALDLMLMRASSRCDNYTKRRLGAPATTTVGTGGIIAGGMTLPVTTTLGFDNGGEQAVLVGSGATQELLPLSPGGTTTYNMPPTAPYAGTLTLSQPAAFSHAQGEPVVGYYQELSVLSHASNEDPFQEAYTQEAQLAQMHAPALSHGMDMTRLIFTKSYPLQSLYSVQYTYSYDTQYYSFPTSAIVTMNPQGFYRLRLGSVLLPGGFVRTTYQAGFNTVPDEIKRAVLSYMKAEVADLVNPYGVASQTLGKQSRSFLAGSSLAATLEAEELLKRYVRKV